MNQHWEKAVYNNEPVSTALFLRDFYLHADT